MINVVPCRFPFQNKLLPPCLSTTTEWAIAKPLAGPFPTPFVVKNGSNTRAARLLGNAVPVSRIRILPNHHPARADCDSAFGSVASRAMSPIAWAA